MPLLDEAEKSIKANLEAIARGERPRVIEIGFLTVEQFTEVNRLRREMQLHELADNRILFLGKHLYASRSADGYTIEDMVMQIQSALSAGARVSLDRFRSVTQNPVPRADGYGNNVNDLAVLEMTARRPKAELFSVIPKGDAIKPAHANP